MDQLRLRSPDDRVFIVPARFEPAPAPPAKRRGTVRLDFILNQLRLPGWRCERGDRLEALCGNRSGSFSYFD
jgi:hypothetical protein